MDPKDLSRTECAVLCRLYGYSALRTAFLPPGAPKVLHGLAVLGLVRMRSVHAGWTLTPEGHALAQVLLWPETGK